MTLKDYTDFVIALGRKLDIISLSKARKTRLTIIFSSVEGALNWGLRIMMGDSAWEKFVALFYNIIGLSNDPGHKTTLGAHHVYKNQEDFWSTLAEFCEPLIGKEGPKEGEDAAKT